MATMKVFMPLRDQKIGLIAYKNLLDSLKVSVTPILLEATKVLPLVDVSVGLCVNHNSFMSNSSYEALFSKSKLYLTGIPTLPTTIVSSSGDTTLYHYKKDNRLPSSGWVQQPLIVYPISQPEITFSVNTNREIYVFNTSFHIFRSANFSGETQPLDNYSLEISAKMLEYVTAACNTLNIRGGVHNVQFLQYNGQLCLSDWNMRPPSMFSEGIAAQPHTKIENLLRHSFDLPLIEETPISIIFREYSKSPIPFHKVNYIKGYGLVPRFGGSNKMGFIRISGIGTSDQELNARFDAMEQGL